MKKISILIFAFTLACCSIDVFAQKSRTAPAKKYRTIIKLPPKPKVEVENWKIFESKELKLKMSFPKEPTISVADEVPYESEALKSSIAQTYINGNFYMVEVREYPENLLPDKLDLSKNYGEWMKIFILPKTKIISEKTFDYEFYRIVEFTYQQTETDVLVHRALVVGKNLYQIIVQLEIKKPTGIEETRAKNEEKIKKFFDSFEITEKSLNKPDVY